MESVKNKQGIGFEFGHTLITEHDTFCDFGFDLLYTKGLDAAQDLLLDTLRKLGLSSQGWGSETISGP